MHALAGICAWGGRRGTELALGKRKAIVADIGEACASAVVRLRSKMSKTGFDDLVLGAGAMASHIQAELSTKLDAMWSEFPLMLFGFFGERFGYSTVVVAAHMKVCIQNMRGLAKLVLGRLLLLTWAMHLRIGIRSWQCWRRICHCGIFWNTYIMVRGHASALRCSRRNEGDHRNIKLEVRSTFNISAPLVLSRLRSGQTTERMRKSAFVSLVEKLWHKRGKGSVANVLLKHLVPQFRLAEMTWHKKCLHILAFAASDLFDDTPNAKHLVRDFKLALPHCPRAILSKMDVAVVHMCMDISVPGNIISVPRAFLNSTPFIGPRPLLDFGAIVESLESATSLPPVSDVGDVDIFLQVGITRDRIVLVNSDYQHSVRCMIMHVCNYDEEEVRLSITGRFVDIDFDIVTQSALRLQLFTRMVLWTCTDATTSVAPKRFCLGDAAASNDARGTALPLARGRHTVLALTNGDHSVDSVGSQLQPTQTEQDDTLCMLLDVGAVDGGVVYDMPSFLDHGGIATSTLINRGMLVARLDDFGEHRLALNPESTYLTSFLTVTESCLLPKRTAGTTVVSHTLSK